MGLKTLIQTPTAPPGGAPGGPQLFPTPGGSGNRNIDMRNMRESTDHDRIRPELHSPRMPMLPGGGPKDIKNEVLNDINYGPQQPPSIAGQFGLGGLNNLMNIPGQMTGFGETLGGFGEQLTGFGDQMTGYQDALGGFNEQVGGFGKQFENLNTRLDSMEKGIASLGEQFQPQQQQQQQNPYANFYSNSNSNPFGSSMYGGLGSMMRYF